MKAFSFIIKYIMLIAIALIVSIMLSNYKNILPVYTENFNIYIAFLVIYTLMYILFLRRKHNIHSVLIHELARYIFARITFKKFTALVVTYDSGGVSQWEGDKNYLVLLAPYFFPLVTILLILISKQIPSTYTIHFNVLLAISYISFLFSIFRDFSIRSYDILECGQIFSVLFIGLINFIFLIFIIHFLSVDSSGFIKLFDYTNLLKIL